MIPARQVCRPVAGPLDDRQEFAGHGEGSENVRGERSLEAIRRDLVGIGERAGIVDERIDTRQLRKLDRSLPD